MVVPTEVCKTQASLPDLFESVPVSYEGGRGGGTNERLPFWTLKRIPFTELWFNHEYIGLIANLRINFEAATNHEKTLYHPVSLFPKQDSQDSLRKSDGLMIRNLTAPQLRNLHCYVHFETSLRKCSY